jgi:phenylalanyl-tRNA synthetase alpha chain
LEVGRLTSYDDVEALRVRFLGKKGLLAELMVFLKESGPEQRPLMGEKINSFKQEVTGHLDRLSSSWKAKERSSLLEKEAVDPTLPGRQSYLGRAHPIQSMLQTVLDILISMGFSIQLGPDVDTDYYNFEGLNFSPDHPARDMQDTFYLNQGFLLRTHTSNTQVHVLKSHAPPVRVVAPGRCFRNEDISSRSHVFFHQVEGFYVDHKVSFADLLGTMDYFLKRLLGSETKTRFRPSYFPFVEPGLEVDVMCRACHEKGCRLCKQTGWLEILGAGMIHPSVLLAAKIDPEAYTGYAWGLGIERLTLLEHGIPDIRMLTENDLRFLSQFP